MTYMKELKRPSINPSSKTLKITHPLGLLHGSFALRVVVVMVVVYFL